MTPKQAALILVRHNKWRRGGNGKPTDGKPLGVAIELAIKVLRAEK